MMTVPRSVQAILDHAEDLAQRFEDYEPADGDERDPNVHAALRRAVVSRSDAERAIRDAVDQARAQGYSWAFIGKIIGTSGEAARQRYGHKQGVWTAPTSSDWNRLPSLRRSPGTVAAHRRELGVVDDAERRLIPELAALTVSRPVGG